VEGNLQWASSPETFSDGNASVDYWSFEGAVASSEVPGLPVYVQRFRVNGPGKLQVEVVRANYEDFDWGNPPEANGLSGSLNFESSISPQREGYFGKIAFVPIVERGGRYQRLTSFELRVRRLPGGTAVAQRDPNNTTT
jgi:hypothetical protein